MLPILISVSVAPVSYFFCASAPLEDAASTATAAGHTFRWSEPQAAVRIKGLPGRNTVCIRILTVREPLDEIGTQFYLDGARVDPSAIDIGFDRYTLSLDLPKSGVATLAWACPVLRGVGDVRRLGLSIVAIDVNQDACDGDQKDSGLSAAIPRVSAISDRN